MRWRAIAALATLGLALAVVPALGASAAMAAPLAASGAASNAASAQQLICSTSSANSFGASSSGSQPGGPWLPIDRWASVAGSDLHTRLSGGFFGISDLGQEANRELQSLALSLGNTLWQAGTDLVALSGQFCFAGQVGVTIDHTAAALGNALTSSGIVAAVVVALVILLLWRHSRHGSGLWHGLWRMALTLGVLAAMLAGASSTHLVGGTADFGTFSPGWLVNEVYGTISTLASAPTALLSEQPSGLAGVASQGPASCGAYVSTLVRHYEATYGGNPVSQASAASLPVALNDMWEQAGLRTYTEVQFGAANPYGDWAYCHQLDYNAGYTAADQAEIAREALNGTGAAVYPQALAWPAPGSPNPTVDASIVGWAACEGYPGHWGIPAAWASGANVTTQDCDQWWTSSSIPSSLNIGPSTQTVEQDASQASANGGALADFLLNYHGDANGTADAAAITYAISSLVVFVVFAILAGAVLVAKVALLVVMLLLAAVALLSVWPGHGQGRIGQVARYMLGLIVFATGAQLLLALVALVTGLVSEMVSSLAGQGTFLDVLTMGFAPVGAVYILHFVFTKLLKAPSPFKFSGALAWASSAGAVGAGAANALNRQVDQRGLALARSAKTAVLSRYGAPRLERLGAMQPAGDPASADGHAAPPGRLAAAAKTATRLAATSAMTPGGMPATAPGAAKAGTGGLGEAAATAGGLGAAKAGTGGLGAAAAAAGGLGAAKAGAGGLGGAAAAAGVPGAAKAGAGGLGGAAAAAGMPGAAAARPVAGDGASAPQAQQAALRPARIVGERMKNPHAAALGRLGAQARWGGTRPTSTGPSSVPAGALSAGAMPPAWPTEGSQPGATGPAQSGPGPRASSPNTPATAAAAPPAMPGPFAIDGGNTSSPHPNLQPPRTSDAMPAAGVPPSPEPPEPAPNEALLGSKGATEGIPAATDGTTSEPLGPLPPASGGSEPLPPTSGPPHGAHPGSQPAAMPPAAGQPHAMPPVGGQPQVAPSVARPQRLPAGATAAMTERPPQPATPATTGPTRRSIEHGGPRDLPGAMPPGGLPEDAASLDHSAAALGAGTATTARAPHAEPEAPPPQPAPLGSTAEGTSPPEPPEQPTLSPPQQPTSPQQGPAPGPPTPAAAAAWVSWRRLAAERYAAQTVERKAVREGQALLRGENDSWAGVARSAVNDRAALARQRLRSKPLHTVLRGSAVAAGAVTVGVIATASAPFAIGAAAVYAGHKALRWRAEAPARQAERSARRQAALAAFRAQAASAAQAKPMPQPATPATDEGPTALPPPQG